MRNVRNVETLFLNNTKCNKKYKILKKIRIFCIRKLFFCCIAKKHVNKLIYCLPKKFIMENCHKIIPSLYLEIFCLVFGIFCLFRNILLIFIRIFSKKSISFHLYYLNLNLSDAFTAVFLIIIYIVNSLQDPEAFLEVREIWKRSITCKFIGSSMNYSLISGLLTVLFITFEDMR